MRQEYQRQTERCGSVYLTIDIFSYMPLFLYPRSSLQHKRPQHDSAHMDEHSIVRFHPSKPLSAQGHIVPPLKEGILQFRYWMRSAGETELSPTCD